MKRSGIQSDIFSLITRIPLRFIQATENRIIMTQLKLHQFCTTLLEPFDLQLDAGDCITLSGPSGCGKSMLLRAIADLDPHQGEIQLDDRPQQQFSGPEWRRQVGLLPAESGWWHEQVRQHFSDPDTELLQRLDFSLDVLEWPVMRLSSGERQRLALIRLLQNQPAVLLLDEPTANLDATNRTLVEQLVADYQAASGAIVLWVSHDPEQQQRVGSRHLEIKEGRLCS